MSVSWCDFIAGWSAGISGLIIGHPLDTIKVRQQIFQSSGIMQIAVQTLRNESVYGFYKGMGFPLLSAGVMNSIFFGVYGNCLRALENYQKQYSGDANKYWHTNIFLAGAFAGVVQVAVGCPVDLIKIQLQSQTGTWPNKHKHLRKNTGPLNCFLQIFRTHGLKGVYHGCQIMIYRDSFSSGLYVLTYAQCLSMLYGPTDVMTVLVAGGTAGTEEFISNNFLRCIIMGFYNSIRCYQESHPS